MAAHPSQTPSLISTYTGELHVGASFGSVVRLSCANLSDTEAAPQTVDFHPGRYQLGRLTPFIIPSRACSRTQADLLVSSHTVAVTPRGKPTMRLTRNGGETFVMTVERNYQIFDGDAITMGESKHQITFSFQGKLKELELDLEAKEAARKAKAAPAVAALPAV